MKRNRKDELTLVFRLYLEDLKRMFYYLRHSYVGLLGLGLAGFVILLAIFGPYVIPYPQDVGKIVRLNEAFLPPSSKYLFGTDFVGRDIFSRVIAGARLTLSIALSGLAVILVIGVPLGLVAGYFGGWIGTLIMRITDVFQAIPPILLALVVASTLAPSMQNLILALAFSWWPQYTRLVNGEVLSIKEDQYVEASRSLGAGAFYIIRNDIFPRVTSPLIVKTTLDVGYLVLTAAGLGFLGLGAQPPTPEWGAMISDGLVYLPAHWWIVMFPGLFILLAVLGFNLLGDGLRDVLNQEI